MLILSRMKGQSILIGDDIEITVNEIRGARVSLAVSAPKEVLVLRSEVPRTMTEKTKSKMDAYRRAD